MPADAPPLPANANTSLFAVDRYCHPPGRALDWHPVTIDVENGGRPIRWFPIADQTPDVLAKLAEGCPLRIWHRAAGRKCKPLDRGIWHPEAPAVEPVPAPAPPATPPPASPPPPTAPAPAPSSPAASVPSNGRSALALMPPGYVPKPPASHMPAPADAVYERAHYMAAEDADRVVVAVTNLASAFQSATAQMAAATIAVSGQRATEWQGLASQLLAQATAPKPPDPALAQLAAAVQALAQGQQAIAAKVEELEADDDEPPAGPTEPTDGQRLMAAIAPIAIEYGPKIAAKLWPEPGPATVDGSPRA